MLEKNEPSKEKRPTDEQFSDLEWIKIRTHLDAQSGKQNSFLNKFKSKASENPFIPLGLFLTTCCLGVGLYSMYKGQTYRSQMMMRARVLAQSFTVIVLVGGVGLAAAKKGPPSKES